MTADLGDVAGSIRAKCDALSAILTKLEVEGGPSFEDSYLPISWSIFIGQGFEGKGETAQAIGDLEHCKKLAEKLVKCIRELPQNVVFEMEEESYLVTRRSLDSDNGTGSSVPRHEHRSYDAIITELIRDLNSSIGWLKEIKRDYWGGPTKSKDALAYKIALDVARVYTKLQNRLPGYGPGNTIKPATPYVKIVGEVYELMGVEAKPRDPCRAAAAQLKSEADD